MTGKHYRRLAEILESKCENGWLVIDIADFLEANFDNFNRKKFMLACGFDRAYTYDELLTIYFNNVDKMANQNVKVFTRN